MEVGEPVSVAPGPPTPDNVEFEAQIVLVTFKGVEKSSRDNATISPPHWDGSDPTDDWSDMANKLGLPTEPYSKKAAVYLRKSAGGSYDVDVKVKITKSKNVSGDAKLLGNLSALTIEGTCPTSAGEHMVSAKITTPPDTVAGYVGKAGWGLELTSPGMTYSMNLTLLEVYFVLAKPTAPHQTNGVWSEALRLLVGKAGVRGASDEAQITRNVAQYCHSTHGLRYDTFHGAPHYGVSNLGGGFQLKKFLMKGEPICNCYDQAAAVQTLSGAVGVSLVWKYLQPFGYIKPTALIGVGLCNSPFFGSDESKRMVPWDSPDRTGFGNHAFTAVSGMILDSCAGPHTGTETPAQYVDASIDSTPSLYSGHRAGTAGDIVDGAGVTSLS